MSEQECVALWLQCFNKQWKQERKEQSKNEIWYRVPKYNAGSCDYGNYANQDRDIRLEKSVVICE